MYKSRLALILSLLSLFATSLAAHEQPTHQNLTVAALNYIKANDPARFALLQQYPSIYSTLAAGAWNEDDNRRYVFHFLPNLNDVEFATCSSVDWGIAKLSCTSSLPIVNIGRFDEHTWPDALSAVDSTTGAPTLLGWTHLGYVIHLLEDLTSPPHARNSAHPCLFGLAYCDPFEPDNELSPVSFPNSDYIGLSNLSGPQDLFQRVRNYTHDNYFSDLTIFNGDGGPIETFENPDYTSPDAYFYGACLPASVDFKTCDTSTNRRKIAYKGPTYYSCLENSTCPFAPRTLADINTVIAKEQFSELAPPTVYAVAALIRLYAPMLTVQLQGDNGTGSVTSSPATGINCGTTCTPALFVTGTTVTLTAADSSTEVFSGWGQDCTGTAKSVTVTLTADMTCFANFSPLPPNTLTVQKGGNGTGTVTSFPAGINCGTGCLIQSAPFNGPVLLTALADPGSSFTSWGGNCSGTALTTTISVTTSNESCIASFSASGTLTVTDMGTGAGTVVSIPAGINCGSTCTAPFTGSVQLTATPLPGSTFASWGGDCSGTNPTTTINVSGNKNCTATFNSPVAVALNPFGTQTISQAPGPYNVGVVNGLISPIAAPATITVTLLRQVVSQCSGLLFSSNVIATIAQGQVSTTYGFVAGRDPACNTLPITTTFTVTQAVMAPNTTLDLSIVPAQQLILSVTR
jgi:hypothetical protein